MERENKIELIDIYVDGTSARVPQPVSEGETKTSPRVRKNRERVQRVTAPYLLFLAAALGLCLYACVSLLQVQASITNHRYTIKNLKTQLEELTTDNDSMELLLDSYTDLENIAEIAAEELGMVYPSEDQVIYYAKTENGYVRQYEDIPTE